MPSAIRKPLAAVSGWLCVCAMIFAAEPEAEILVQDSFESGNKAPDGWQQGMAVPGVRYVYDKSTGSEGKRSLSLQKSENRYFPIAAWMKAFDHKSKQTTLRLSTKVKAQKVAKAIIEVQFYGQNQQFLSKEWASYIGQKQETDPVVTHDWQAYEATVDIPEGTKQIAISLQIYGPGKIWFDELDARYGAAGDAKSDSAPIAKVASTTSTEPNAIPNPLEISTKTGAVARYFLIGPQADAKPPTGGFPLLLVLPGGDGSVEFHPFIRRIQEQGLNGRFVVAQLVAPPQITWPTIATTAQFQSTEQSIDAVIDDVAKRVEINRKQVYALGWSSGGPPIYATILQPGSSLAGAFIAMSVFRPDQLPPVENAKGRRIYLLHSPDDNICPYRMAQSGKDQFAKAGVSVTLVDYEGGHGWHGPIFDQIRAGMDWLQNSKP